MKKQLKDAIKKDFESKYKFEVNREELYSNLNIVTRERTSLLQFLNAKISKNLLVLRTILICTLLILIGTGVTYSQVSYVQQNDNIITEEFEIYIRQQGHKITKQPIYCITVSNEIVIYVYNFTVYEVNTTSFYYIFKFPYEIENSYIILDGEKIEISNNSFGLLATRNTSDFQRNINFSIEIDGQLKQFLLN